MVIENELLKRTVVEMAKAKAKLEKELKEKNRQISGQKTEIEQLHINLDDEKKLNQLMKIQARLIFDFPLIQIYITVGIRICVVP